jgi:hypothetical protein
MKPAVHGHLVDKAEAIDTIDIYAEARNLLRVTMALGTTVGQDHDNDDSRHKQHIAYDSDNPSQHTLSLDTLSANNLGNSSTRNIDITCAKCHNNIRIHRLELCGELLTLGHAPWCGHHAANHLGAYTLDRELTSRIDRHKDNLVGKV